MVKKYLDYISENQEDNPQSYEETGNIPIKVDYEELRGLIDNEFEIPEEHSSNPYSTRTIELLYNKGKVIDLEYGEVDIEIGIEIGYKFDDNEDDGYYDTISYSDVTITPFIDGGDFSETDYEIVYIAEGLVTDKTNMEEYLLNYIKKNYEQELIKIGSHEND